MNITLKIPEEMFNQLAAKKQVAIYRIAEEQLNNIIKQAHADRANIQLLREGGRMCLLVKENGRRFDPEHKGRGIGSSNNQSRTESLDGQMEIIGGLGKGCKLK